MKQRLFVVGQGEEARLVIDLDDVSSITAGPLGAKLPNGQREFQMAVLMRSGTHMTAVMGQNQVDHLVLSLQAWRAAEVPHG